MRAVWINRYEERYPARRPAPWAVATDLVAAIDALTRFAT
jgi:hypothetical protein